jgi:elongation factor Ts
MVSLDDIKFLRDHTGMSIAECRKALDDSGGDRTQALEELAKRGAAIAEKKSSRETGEGRIEAYVHATGKVAGIVSLQCETDFVARNDLFKKLAHDLAMHVAAMAPRDAEALLEQEFVREPGKTVGQYITEAIARLGENIKITKFERWEL